MVLKKKKNKKMEMNITLMFWSYIFIDMSNYFICFISSVYNNVCFNVHNTSLVYMPNNIIRLKLKSHRLS